MADWEEWGEIIARCMGYQPMEFINAYTNNTKLQSDLVLEDRPVARAVVKLFEKLPEGEEWAGYTSKLLEELEAIAVLDLELTPKREPLWPKAANALSYRLNEVKPNLRDLGIEIYETFDNSKLKILHIHRVKSSKKPSPKSTTIHRISSPESPASPVLEFAKHETTEANKPLDSKSGGPGDTGDVVHTFCISRGKKKVTIDLDFDTNNAKVVNLSNDQCDILIGQNWPKGKANHPLAGMSGYLGNPFVIDKDGDRNEILVKYKQWLYHGTDVVNGRDPGEYRRKALEELPGHYAWGCYCAPQKCHGDILLKWLRRQLQIQRAHRRAYEKKHANKSSTEEGDTK